MKLEAKEKLLKRRDYINIVLGKMVETIEEKDKS
jgi:hypothetical protein